jgi:hypothetical protein
MIKVAPVKLENGEQLLPPHAGGNNNGDYMTKLVDLDGDGDLDILQGTRYHIWYYENVGTKQAPLFRSHDKIIVEGKPLMVSGHAGSVEAVDWNGDGKVDIVIGGESGWTYYFDAPSWMAICRGQRLRRLNRDHDGVQVGCPQESHRR